MKNSIKERRQGFTLIELMVVIAIIGILSAIILANFSAAKSKSRDGQRISDVAQIQLALAGYFNQCNDYPNPDTSAGNGTSYIDSSTLSQNVGCPSGVTLATFISKIPTPPAGAGQTNYSYAIGYYSTDSSKTPVDYALEATLENNSSVSTESLSSFPSTSGITYPASFTCNSNLNYCLGPK